MPKGIFLKLKIETTDGTLTDITPFVRSIFLDGEEIFSEKDRQLAELDNKYEKVLADIVRQRKDEES